MLIISDRELSRQTGLERRQIPRYRDHIQYIWAHQAMRTAAQVKEPRQFKHWLEAFAQTVITKPKEWMDAEYVDRLKDHPALDYPNPRRDSHLFYVHVLMNVLGLSIRDMRLYMHTGFSIPAFENNPSMLLKRSAPAMALVDVDDSDDFLGVAATKLYHWAQRNYEISMRHGGI